MSLPARVVEAGHVLQRGPSDDDLADVLHDGVGESHLLFALRGDDDGGGDDVSDAFVQGGFELIGAHGDEDDFGLERAGLELLIDELLELLECLVVYAFGQAVLVEETNRIDQHQGANRAALHHVVEIVGVFSKADRAATNRPLCRSARLR